MARPTTTLLTVDAIVDAALEAVDAGESLGMRSLAKRLAVAPSSLYHHVRSLPHLVNLIRDRLGRDRPVGEGHWAEQLSVGIRAQRGIYARHPKLLPLLVATPITSPFALQHYEDLAATLLSTGMTAADAAIVLEILDSFAIGSGLEAAGADQAWDGIEAAPKLLAVTLAWANTADKLETAFETGLAILIGGIRDRFEVGAAGSSRWEPRPADTERPTRPSS